MWSLTPPRPRCPPPSPPRGDGGLVAPRRCGVARGPRGVWGCAAWGDRSMARDDRPIEGLHSLRRVRAHALPLSAEALHLVHRRRRGDVTFQHMTSHITSNITSHRVKFSIDLHLMHRRRRCDVTFYHMTSPIAQRATDQHLTSHYITLQHLTSPHIASSSAYLSDPVHPHPRLSNAAESSLHPARAAAVAGRPTAPRVRRPAAGAAPARSSSATPTCERWHSITSQLHLHYNCITIALQLHYNCITFTITVQLQYNYSTSTVQSQCNYSAMTVKFHACRASVPVCACPASVGPPVRRRIAHHDDGRAGRARALSLCLRVSVLSARGRRRDRGVRRGGVGYAVVVVDLAVTSPSAHVAVRSSIAARARRSAGGRRGCSPRSRARR